MKARPITRLAFTLVELIVVLGIILLLAALILPAIQRVREAANRLSCRSNMKSIGVALTQYHLNRKKFPPALNTVGGQYVFLSWQARLLPYLEDGNRWSEIQTAFSVESMFWKGPHLAIRACIMQGFLCPSDNEQLGTFSDWGAAAGLTHYVAISGSSQSRYDGVLFPNSATSIRDIDDGLANTIVVGERPASANLRFGWWYAGIGQQMNGCLDSHMSVREINQTFYAPTSPIGPYHFQRGTQDDMSGTFHFWSLHVGGAHFLFADGSVRFLSYSSDPILPALASRAGKEAVVVPID